MEMKWIEDDWKSAICRIGIAMRDEKSKKFYELFTNNGFIKVVGDEVEVISLKGREKIKKDDLVVLIDAKDEITKDFARYFIHYFFAGKMHIGYVNKAITSSPTVIELLKKEGKL